MILPFSKNEKNGMDLQSPTTTEFKPKPPALVTSLAPIIVKQHQSSSTETELYLEVRSNTRRTGTPELILSTALAEAVGRRAFRSTYLFRASVKQIIEANQSLAGLAGISVVSQTLFIDVDSSPEDAARVWTWLGEQGLEAEHWHTGRRGGHFHIPIKEMEGPLVPVSQRTWVEANVPVKCDVTIYKVSGQFRLPGTVHEKAPGCVKQLSERREGRILEIPMISVPPPIQHLTVPADFDSRENWVLDLQREVGEGGRAGHLYKLVLSALKAGKSEEEAVSAAVFWNNTFCTPPHSEDYVVAKMRANWAQVSRSPRGSFNQVPHQAEAVRAGQVGNPG